MKLTGQSFFQAITFGAALFASSQVSVAQEAPSGPMVSIAVAHTEGLVLEATFIGRGKAIDKVDIVARVSGFLQDFLVKNGADVKKGEVLFKIEPGTYAANLAARKAEKASAVAQLKLAQIELDRKSELLRRESGTVADRDIAQANFQVAEANIEIADATIQLAELDLSYTSVAAPFDGRIGRANPSVGELVGPTTSPLVTLIRTAPIYVEFSLTEKQLVNFLQVHDASLENLANGSKALDVFVSLPNGTQLEEVGHIVFADNRIDPATGTVSLDVEFPNDNGLIFDGSFVSLRIEDNAPTDALLIPQAAVQRDQRGDFVLVVGAEQTVEQRYVTLGRQDGVSVVVDDGLVEGEAVIIEGLQRVRPGVEVNAILAGSATSAEGN
ncbi:efflux RND transporter periplasmic adaptor subunit [Falsihalocynthiibacter sp. S25ZX9]|uniref:efflux RND transporter periplasmic adaptor subunit n=1 Tax=Falsihalocynthiibacter sp. S25ZX9 TaxID=3240870 RepID=UPI003510A545